MSKQLLQINSRFNKLLLLASGAVAGAWTRYQVNNNLLVNILGSAVIGLVFGLRFRQSFYLLIGVGFCGSLTTFSGWMLDCFRLVTDGEYLEAFMLIFASLLLGLIAVTLGVYFGGLLRTVKQTR